MSDQEAVNQNEVINENDVHVMPSLGSDQPVLEEPNKKKSNFLVIGIAVAVIFAIGIGVGVYFLFFANKTTEQPVVESQPTEAVVEQPVEVATTTPTSTPATATSSYDLLTVDGRDQQRLNDVVTLRLALEQYYKNQSQFPYELGALLDGYLTSLPKEPMPDSKIQSYSYVVDANRFDFKLIFTIEGNPTFFSVRLTPGKYYASRQSIMPYQETGEVGTNLPGGNTGTNPQLPFSLTPPASGLDSDVDGLTDIEENIWSTDPANADSDSDTYKDKDELLTFYDPAVAKKRLLEGKTAAVYKNATHYYSVVYPSAFAVRALPPDNQQIIFSDPNGAFFTVAVEENSASLSTYAWYQIKNPTISTTNFRSFLVDNFPALQTPDGLITYVAVGNKVFVISYNLGTINEANYITTYRLFLKSFMIDETAVAPVTTIPVATTTQP
jgi:flagellar basal body-associated protein FliL